MSAPIWVTACSGSMRWNTCSSRMRAPVPSANTPVPSWYTWSVWPTICATCAYASKLRGRGWTMSPKRSRRSWAMPNWSRPSTTALRCAIRGRAAASTATIRMPPRRSSRAASTSLRRSARRRSAVRPTEPAPRISITSSRLTARIRRPISSTTSSASGTPIRV